MIRKAGNDMGLSKMEEGCFYLGYREIEKRKSFF